MVLKALSAQKTTTDFPWLLAQRFTCSAISIFWIHNQWMCYWVFSQIRFSMTIYICLYVLLLPWPERRKRTRTWHRSSNEYGLWSPRNGPIAAVAFVPCLKGRLLLRETGAYHGIVMEMQSSQFFLFRLDSFFVDWCIEKPLASSFQLSGIYKSIEEVRARVDSKERAWAVQKYIEKPLLIHHRTLFGWCWGFVQNMSWARQSY